jgi:hypothetical protein
VYNPDKVVKVDEDLVIQQAGPPTRYEKDFHRWIRTLSYNRRDLLPNIVDTSLQGFTRHSGKNENHRQMRTLSYNRRDLLSYWFR